MLFAGSVGDAISVMTPDVYISDDGGYTWARMLQGPHHYAILDSGGIIVAIEQTMQPINVIKYAKLHSASAHVVEGLNLHCSVSGHRTTSLNMTVLGTMSL